jgi:hypothetical protein
MRHHATAAVAALLLLTACGGTDEGPIADQPVDGAPDDEVPVEEPGDDADDGQDETPGDDVTDPADDGSLNASDPLLGPEVETAMADVIERTGASQDEVSVTVTELVTWPDGAVGCPEPDMMYTQALVDGYRIVLEVDGEAYAYVGANGSEPTYCEDPQDPVS